MPTVGSGRPFRQQAPSRWLAAIGLLLILGLLQATVLTDWGHRFEQQIRFQLQRFRRRSEQPSYPRLTGDGSQTPRLMV